MSTTFLFMLARFSGLAAIKLGKWKSQPYPCSSSNSTVNREKKPASLFISIHFAHLLAKTHFHVCQSFFAQSVCVCVCSVVFWCSFNFGFVLSVSRKTSVKFTTSCVNTCRSYAGRWHMQIYREKSWKALGFLHTGCWLRASHDILHAKKMFRGFMAKTKSQEQA